MLEYRKSLLDSSKISTYQWQYSATSVLEQENENCSFILVKLIFNYRSTSKTCYQIGSKIHILADAQLGIHISSSSISDAGIGKTIFLKLLQLSECCVFV